MTYIENEKLPDDRGYERINNRFVSILGEIKRLQESLSVNQSKLRDLIKKEYEAGNKVLVNDMRAESPTKTLISCYDSKDNLHIIDYKNITSVVITRKE
jgi:hypothetical protein